MAAGQVIDAAARFRAFALAARARLQLRNLNLHRLAERRFFKRQRQVVAKVVALRRAGCVRRRAAGRTCRRTRRPG